jgi:hypothetical protein
MKTIATRMRRLTRTPTFFGIKFEGGKTMQGISGFHRVAGLLILLLVLLLISGANNAPSAAAQQPAPLAQGGIVVNAVDNDPENKLTYCDTWRVPFGNKDVDRQRCFTFRYSVPPGGITSAILYVSLDTLGANQENDTLNLAVGKPYAPDTWGQGKMPGCVVLHGGGFVGMNKSLVLNLLDIACDKSVKTTPEAQALVREQLQTGTLHMDLQDDTTVYSAQLVLNGPVPSNLQCGASNNPVPPTGPGSSTGTGATNTTLPMPPFGQAEPYPNTPGMAIQAAQRQVGVGELVDVPVWLIKGNNVANINYELTYNANVARPEGTIRKGYLLDNALFSVNPNTSGIIRVGFAQATGINGTGPVTYIPFRATGKVGDRTPLSLAVTTINNPTGATLAIDRIPGEIVIVGPGVLTPGDCAGDGGPLTMFDAMCALQMSVKLISTRLVMDLDRSGDVTSRDAAIIAQKYTGLIP